MASEEESKGFLITCDRDRQKQAIKDAYNFLSQYIQRIYYDLQTQLMQKELQKEGKELNLQNQLKASNKVSNKLLYSVDTHVKCLIFIKINHKYPQVQPNQVVQTIMKDIHENNAQVTRYCHKILPVEKCFKAQHFKMLDNIDQLFQKRDNSQIRSWALNFKCRNNSKFNYKEILTETQKIAKKYGHFVDIYYPQWTVSIEITHHLMCLSINQKYKDYKQFKLRRKDNNSSNNSKREDRPQTHNKRQFMQEKRKYKQQQRIKQQKQQQQYDDGPQHVQQGQQVQKKCKLLDEKIEVNEEQDFDII